MSIKWMEGFGTYNRLTSYISRKWAIANIGSSAFTTGRAGGNTVALDFLGSSLTTPSLGNSATWTIGFAFQATNLASSVPVVILQMLDASSVQVDLRYNPNSGIFTITNGTATLGTGTTVLLANTWYYIEIQVTFDASIGAVGLHINQNSDISVTSLNTATDSNAYANAFNFASTNATSGGYFIDDIYMANASSPNNTYLGDMKIETLSTSAAGIYTGWTPSPSNVPNYQGAAALNDLRTISTDTAGAIDTYVFNNLQLVTGGIKAVQEVVWAANSDSNTHSLKAHLDSSGTQFDSSAQTTTTTGYLPYCYIQETDPNTSVAWTVAGVDQCQFGLNLVS